MSTFIQKALFLRRLPYEYITFGKIWVHCGQINHFAMNTLQHCLHFCAHAFGDWPLSSFKFIWSFLDVQAPPDRKMQWIVCFLILKEKWASSMVPKTYFIFLFLAPHFHLFCGYLPEGVSARFPSSPCPISPAFWPFSRCIIALRFDWHHEHFWR